MNTLKSILLNFFFIFLLIHKNAIQAFELLPLYCIGIIATKIIDGDTYFSPFSKDIQSFSQVNKYVYTSINNVAVAQMLIEYIAKSKKISLLEAAALLRTRASLALLEKHIKTDDSYKIFKMIQRIWIIAKEVLNEEILKETGIVIKKERSSKLYQEASQNNKLFLKVYCFPYSRIILMTPWGTLKLFGEIGDIEGDALALQSLTQVFLKRVKTVLKKIDHSFNFNTHRYYQIENINPEVFMKPPSDRDNFLKSLIHEIASYEKYLDKEDLIVNKEGTSYYQIIGIDDQLLPEWNVCPFNQKNYLLCQTLWNVMNRVYTEDLVVE